MHNYSSTLTFIVFKLRHLDRRLQIDGTDLCTHIIEAMVPDWILFNWPVLSNQSADNLSAGGPFLHVSYFINKDPFITRANILTKKLI